MKKLNQAGFDHILSFILFVVVIGAVGMAGVKVSQQDEPAAKPASQAVQQADTTASKVRWELTGENTWMAMNGTPPACNDPYQLDSPTPALRKASAVLTPGQERQGTFEGQGGNYKPHGGFRFDGLKPTDVAVVSPIDGFVYRGSSYLAEGEQQYFFDIINPCGYMVRLGHLQQLSPAFQAIAAKFPPAQEGDSRSEKVQGDVLVKAGDPIASAVGFNQGPNVFFDFGVYDLRDQNTASKDPAFQQKHADSKELSWYGVCWYDLLPTADSKFVKNLKPADGVAGKTSDYCK